MQVFISYGNAPAEERVVGWLFRLLSAHSVDAWVDYFHLRPKFGPELHVEIAGAIRGSAGLLFIASAHSFGSTYCRAEVSYALSIGKTILTLLVERCDMPDEWLPLRGKPECIVGLHHLQQEEWIGALIQPLSMLGIRLTHDDEDPRLHHPFSSISRPRYLALKTMPVSMANSIIVRLVRAREIYSRNGYNSLNLAKLLLFRGDVRGAGQAARVALDLLPTEPSAWVTQALVLCASHPVARRNLPIVQEMLGLLERAWLLEGASSPAYLLAALIICNFHIRRYLTPPRDISVLLAEGTASELHDGDENYRVFEAETLTDKRHMMLLRPYLPLYLVGM